METNEKIFPIQRKSLAKTMSFKDYVSLGLGTIVGVGWVIVAGDWLNKGGPLGVILAYVLGGLILVAVGMCYAELTPAIPVAGGAVAFSYKAYGAAAAFFSGWFLAFAYAAVCPFEAVAIGWILEFLVPQFKTKALYTIGHYQVSPLSIAAGIVVSLFLIYLNFRGVKHAARFQTISTGVMICCALVFSLVALVKGHFHNLLPLFAGKGKWSGVGSTIAVLGIVPFFMSGFDTIAQGAEESGKKMNPKNLGRAVIISIISGALFYAVVILALSLCLPWQEAIKLELPTADAFRIAFGYDWAAKLVLFTGFLGLVTSFNGCFIAACRVLFALGRGGLLPKWFGQLGKKHQTPVNAILFVGIITLIGPFAGKSSLVPIVGVGSLAYVCGWLMTCLSAIRLRQTAPLMARPYKVKNKIILYLGAAIAGALILLMITPGSSAQLKWPLEYGILVTWMALGFMGYRWRRAQKDIGNEETAYQILGEYR